MRIGFVVNEPETEHPRYTTTELAITAGHLGHEPWILGVADFIYASDGKVYGLARKIPREACESGDALVEVLRDPNLQPTKIAISDLDVLMLRNDPSPDKKERPWAQTPGIMFGHLAVQQGVLVLNDPTHLATALNKTYFQHFPEQVRPETCISRDAGEIKRFADSHGGKIVIKPLDGSGGESVFLLRSDDPANSNQMIEAVIRDGYCIAQAYLPAAKDGDVRLFVMNGQPLQHDGIYAAFRRVNKSGDMRSNMHTGGVSEPVEVDETMLRLVELVRPKLVADGMFLAGLDIVDDKLMEINVFSPGGFWSLRDLTGVNFAEVVMQDIARKLRYKQHYGSAISNAQLATM
ncbi:glutathione synthetase [Candidatus Laterigemmans baculatus]|uniref:glutathione synthetase n=1 Tax=Candidatus Laterigemmans baculatus TaxID=2770505 RepID=UPI0013D90E17|nr:glutathione synthetase [Candidatus Laterigemmans baculatus]